MAARAGPRLCAVAGHVSRGGRPSSRRCAEGEAPDIELSEAGVSSLVQMVRPVPLATPALVGIRAICIVIPTGVGAGSPAPTQIEGSAAVHAAKDLVVRQLERDPALAHGPRPPAHECRL